MNQLETLLRHEFEQEAGHPGPAGRDEVRALVGRIRARRRRRAVAATTFVTMLVIITGGVGARQLVGRAVDPAARPATPPVVVSTEPVYTNWSGIVDGAPVAPVSGDFADASHGFLLVARCETGSQFCRAGLEVTADGGTSWTPRDLPVQPSVLAAGDHPGVSPQIVAVGPRTVVYDRPDVNGAPHRRFVSTDAGQHWREVEILPGPLANRVPEGCRLGIFDMAGNGHHGPTTGCMTADGTALPLATPVTTGYPTSRLIQAPDGTLWADTGAVRHTSDGFGPDLWVNRGPGGTWQAVATPFTAPTDGPVGNGELLTADGHTVYYLALDVTGPTRTIRLYRSRDAGVSWELIDTRGVAPSFNMTNLDVYGAGYPAGKAQLYTSAVALPDGGLVLTWFGRALRVTADGLVTPVLGAPGLSVFAVGHAAIGVSVHGAAPHTAAAFSLTHDGITWTAMTLP